MAEKGVKKDGVVHWTSKGNEEQNKLYLDFFNILEKQPGWKGQVKTTVTGLTLKASTIKPLSDFFPMDYEQTEKMILHLGLQMLILQHHQKGLCCFTLDDVLVIDKEFFFLAGLQNVLDIKGVKSDLLSFTYPMKFTAEATQFFAPELKEKLDAKILPFTVTISVGYYSLAKLCLYGLQLGENLGPLQGSKMYYFLERCLKVDPAERAFLYF